MDILKENNPFTMASQELGRPTHLESVPEINKVSPATTNKRLPFTVKREESQAIEVPDPRLDVLAIDAGRQARSLLKPQERQDLDDKSRKCFLGPPYSVKHFETVQQLLDQGADIHQLIWNKFPSLEPVAILGFAVLICSGQDLVRFLLRRGANVNSLGLGEWTPLKLACYMRKDLQVTQLLTT